MVESIINHHLQLGQAVVLQDGRLICPTFSFSQSNRAWWPSELSSQLFGLSRSQRGNRMAASSRRCPPAFGVEVDEVSGLEVVGTFLVPLDPIISCCLSVRDDLGDVEIDLVSVNTMVNAQPAVVNLQFVPMLNDVQRLRLVLRLQGSEEGLARHDPLEAR